MRIQAAPDASVLGEAERHSSGRAPAVVPEAVASPQKVWNCPGCRMSWTGNEGGIEWRRWKGHIARHVHAR